MTFYSNYNTFQFHGSSNNLESDKVMPFSQKKIKKKKKNHAKNLEADYIS